MSKTRDKKKKSHIIGWTLIGCILLAVVSGIVLQYESYRYEEGILEVCALQQDAYVQLVIDQINLVENRDNEEIITNILSTMDASNNKYWTFSSKQAMLFVKDVLETNKYKGFTTATYYSSTSAKKFLKKLSDKRVTHAEIVLGKKAYIASGASFRYGNEDYRLCLLTNKDVLLDNNRFLGAKIELMSLVSILILVVLVVPVLFAFRVQKDRNEAKEKDDRIETLSHGICKLNEIVSRKNIYDATNGVWTEAALPVFLEKLKQREATPSTHLVVSFKNLEEKQETMALIKMMTNDKVVRFNRKENEVGLLFLNEPYSEAIGQLKKIVKEVQLERVEELNAEGELRGIEKQHWEGSVAENGN